MAFYQLLSFISLSNLNFAHFVVADAATAAAVVAAAVGVVVVVVVSILIAVFSTNVMGSTFTE